MQALVAASGALQRERTALKVMLLLLVEQRDRLQLGEAVPVGDLYDVLAEGEEPFTEQMRIQFEDAKKLYHLKLPLLLEREHGTTREKVKQLPRDDPTAKAFRTDDHLVKTLILAALVPQVEVFAGMTPQELAALNHGSIKTPIEGREGQEVLRRCRRWVAEVGELEVGTDPTYPTISLQRTGIDTLSILANAQAEDRMGNRRRKVKELLHESLGTDRKDPDVGLTVVTRCVMLPHDPELPRCGERVGFSTRARQALLATACRGCAAEAADPGCGTDPGRPPGATRQSPGDAGRGSSRAVRHQDQQPVANLLRVARRERGRGRDRG
jgi:hypothetical protein